MGRNTEKVRKMRVKFGLTPKIMIGMAILALCITAAAVFVSIKTYDEAIKRYYNSVAYQVAETASGYFTEEEMRGYADLVTRYNHGEASKEELQAACENARYNQLWEEIDKLRKSMAANDIYVSVFDMEALENYSDETADDWAPMYYIMDSYYKSEEQFGFGESGKIQPDFRFDVIEAAKTGVHTDTMIFSNYQFGFIMTASYPVAYGGETVAFIAVEIPMSTLQSDISSFVTRLIIAACVVTFIMLIIIVAVFVRIVVKPIGVVADEAEKFVGSDAEVSQRLEKIRTKDEIEMLSGSILKMERDIKDYIENLTKVTAEKERIGAELSVATQIQADMLPSSFPAFPERKDFDIYAAMHPAKEVGGDFYDFFMLDDHRLALVMADVSGKGVPAALFMVIAKTLIKNRALMGGTPKEILDYVNGQLCENNEAELFVTVWLAIVDLDTGKGIAANAGHEHPAIQRAGGGYELVKYKHSPAVAVMEGIRYRDHEFQLYPGDSLYVYTDGVTEAANTQNELFGTQRLLDALNEAPDAAADEVLKNVSRHIDDFVGGAPQFDDITMLCFKYFGARRLRVEAKTEDLEEVIKFIGGHLDRLGCPEKTKKQLETAAEEIFVNIASYAYPDGGDAVITFESGGEPLCACLTFTDNGIPFDPLQKEDPDVTLSAEERQEGGLGIYMVKKTMDEVKYERKGEQNVLTIKRIIE